MTERNKNAIWGLVRLLLFLPGLLFLTAGTLAFWQAWIFLAVVLGSCAATSLYLMKNDPELLERRLRAGPGSEKETSQKIIQVVAQTAYFGAIVIAALDHRFAWSDVPSYLVVAGDAVVGAGFLMIFLVFRENSFASATIEIHTAQRVVSTGPYALVRHPMYLGGLIMFLGVPLALGSWWGFTAVIPIATALCWRLLDEERLLVASLPGYREYRDQVRYRLVPRVW